MAFLIILQGLES